MLVDMFEAGNEAVINDMIQRPRPPAPAAVSIWGQAREAMVAPFKGMAQAVMQTTRVAKEFTPVQAGNPLAMTVSEQETILADEGLSRAAMDKALRKGIDEMNPDPLTATMASQFLQQGARVVTKALGYGVMAGPAGAVVGTGIDEGATGFMEMRDRGVDTATAAKAGAVRGVAMAASVAMPVVGKTLARTAGLVAVGGPGLFVAEQSATREILQRARYGQIASEYDPLDPVGLALSVAVPGAIGVAMHRARVRSAAPAEAPSPWEAMARDPEAVDAALVNHRYETTAQAGLHAPVDMVGGNAHTKTLDDAIRAMDEGAPVQARDVVVDQVRAGAIIGDMQQRLRSVVDELDQVDEVLARVDVVPRGDEWSLPGGLDISQVMENARHLLGVGRTANEAVADFSKAGPVSGLMQNAMVAVQDFPRRIPELIEQYRAIDINRGGLVPPMDVLADAIDRMGAGKPPEAPNRPLARAEMVAREHPTLMVRMDEADRPMRSEDVVGMARIAAKQDLADSKAFEAAVDCLLRVGS